MIEIIFQNVGMLFLVAILSEALTEVLKTTLSEVIKGRITYILSIFIGVILAYAFNLNVFGLQGVPAHVSIVSAGLIASRGANYVNGIMKRIGAIKTIR